MLKGFTKEETSWMMYDWANSSQSVIIVTLLPIFYQTINVNNPASVGIWGYSTSFAMLLIALLSPVLGALGDVKGNKKRILGGFLFIGVMSCFVLGFVPSMDLETHLPQATALILLCYIISQIGFSGANIMYDGLLTDVTTDERMDRVSTMGFGLGYIGGSTIPLILFLIMAIFLPMNTALSVIFVITGIWWGVFSIPLFRNVKQVHYVEKKKGMVLDSLSNLKETFQEIRSNKAIFVFLLAYFFYIDGVNTIIHLSTIYGASLGIDSTQMLLALLMTQVLGLPFAMLYVKASEKFGTRFMICVGIVVYMIICVFAYFITTAIQFWLLAFLVGTSQGGIQALSRSMFGKMIPDKKKSGEYFGFYDIFGKFSAIMGPTIFAVVSGAYSSYLMEQWNVDPSAISEEMALELARKSNPVGTLSLLIIFIVGAVLFIGVLPRVEKEV